MKLVTYPILGETYSPPGYGKYQGLDSDCAATLGGSIPFGWGRGTTMEFVE